MMPHDVSEADRACWKAAFNACMATSLSNEDEAAAEVISAHRVAAIAEERARVVAYLRTRLIANVGDRFADAIERGDHIQEK